jgi:hypothetical protein
VVLTIGFDPGLSGIATPTEAQPHKLPEASRNRSARSTESCHDSPHVSLVERLV